MERKRSVGLTGGWDARISRRTLLRTGGSAAAGLITLGKTAPATAVPPFSGDPFSLGVASGDPTPDSVVLWTRLAPAPQHGGGLDDQVYGVRWELATDEGFSRIVRRGTEAAWPQDAHSVHAEVAGLRPGTEYWYRFKWGPTVSRVGRTRTAPPAGAEPAGLRFAFVSCQNFANGYYPAYADLAQQSDLELVVHLGDYIYEGSGLNDERNVRGHLPARELFSLDDYRTRHAQYKSDPALQAAHAAFAWLLTWDDHEFKDNYANLDIESGDPPEAIAARRAAAYRAYWEHAPLSRARKPVAHDLGLYRRIGWGTLATFHVLDTRQYRDDQITQCTRPERNPSGYCPEQLNPARTILGATQRDWLLEGLDEQPRDGWNILANQVGFAPQDDLESLSLRRFFVDPWDGYVADRQRVLDVLKERDLRNTVVITGDKHQHSVRNVPGDYRNMAAAPVATEFIGSSISSGWDGSDATTHGGDDNNPHILFEAFRRGYVRVELDRETWRSDFRVVDTVRQPDAAAYTLESWMVQNGRPGAFPASAAV